MPVILRITHLPRVREGTSRKGGAILTGEMGYRGIFSVGIIWGLHSLIPYQDAVSIYIYSNKNCCCTEQLDMNWIQLGSP